VAQVKAHSEEPVMAKSKRWITADELMAQLESDPEWVRRRDERNARHAAAVEKLRKELEPEAAPLRRDLSAVGLDVKSIWDLVNMSAPYPKAIPVLLQHLATSRHPVQRQGLARALTVLEAEGVAGGPILRELKRESDPETRWAMANALTIVAAPHDADEIAALVDDPSYADVHERLAQALKNLRPTRTRRTGPGRQRNRSKSR
jgi:hypothetical protein